MSKVSVSKGLSTVPRYAAVVACALMFAAVQPLRAQIYAPEGLNMPGQYNVNGAVWLNPPTNLAFAGVEQAGGKFLPDTGLALRRYKTTINIQSSGGDTAGGTYHWLFTSGPSTNYFQNKWGGVTVAVDTIQAYTLGGADNSVTLSNGEYYTVIFKDNGYANTDAIWMATSALPVTIDSVKQSPLLVTPSDSVTITVNTSTSPSPEEKIYVRYSTDDFATSSNVLVSFSGSTGTAKLPPQPFLTKVSYYVLSTTVNNPTSNQDLVTINYNTNGGKNYSYTSASYTFAVQVAAATDSLSDADNFLGAAASATDGFDSAFDTPEAPLPPSNYLQVSFPHPEYNSSLGNYFANDFRAAADTANPPMTWNLEVNTDQSDKTVTLDFSTKGSMPVMLGMFLFDSTASTLTHLTNGATYSYNSGAGGVRKFAFMLQDTTAAITAAVTAPNGGEIVPAGHSYTIHFTTNAATIDSIQLLYSTDGGTSYTPITTLHALAASSVWDVPSLYYTSTAKVKVVVTDAYGRSAWDASDNNFIITSDSFSTPISAGWNLMATPFDVSALPMSSVLGDDFDSTYYVYGYAGNAYSLFNNSSTLSPAHGYWLGALSTTAIDVHGTVETDSVVIPLSPGFNLIGNPFVIAEPLGWIEFQKGATIASYQTAVTNGWISPAVYGYTNTGYVSLDTMNVWQGAWLAALDSGVAMIAKPAAPAGHLSKAASQPQLAASASNWDVNITAAFRGIRNSLLDFGVKPDATAGFDPRYDTPAPPHAPGGRYVENYFSHSGWNPFFGKFNSDLRAPASSLAWTFSVETSSGDTGAVTLSWDVEKIAASVPPNVSLLMTDNLRATDIPIDMRKSGSYTFAPILWAGRFSINATVTGVSDLPVVPLTTSLGQNYPNPFNPTTIINYQLPMTNYVTLKVYNILGQEVATLVNEQKSPGTYDVNFDASRFSSGVYYYRLQAGSFTDVKKMVVEK